MAGTKSEFCEDNRSIVTLRSGFREDGEPRLARFSSSSGRTARNEEEKGELSNIVTISRTQTFLSHTFPKLYANIRYVFRLYIYPGILREDGLFPFYFFIERDSFLYRHISSIDHAVTSDVEQLENDS